MTVQHVSPFISQNSSVSTSGRKKKGTSVMHSKLLAGLVGILNFDAFLVLKLYRRKKKRNMLIRKERGAVRTLVRTQ